MTMKAEKLPVEFRNRQRDSERRVHQAERLARVLKLIGLCEGDENHTTVDLCHKIGCSERTLYRDLMAIKLAGLPFRRDGEQGFIRIETAFTRIMADLTRLRDELISEAALTN